MKNAPLIDGGHTSVSPSTGETMAKEGAQGQSTSSIELHRTHCGISYTHGLIRRLTLAVCAVSCANDLGDRCGMAVRMGMPNKVALLELHHATLLGSEVCLHMHKWRFAARARQIRPNGHRTQANINTSRSLSSSQSVSSPSSAQKMTSTLDAYLTTSTSSTAQHLPFDAPKLWSSSRPKNEKKAGETRVFYDVDQKGAIGAVVSAGKIHEKKGASEGEKKEALRVAVAEGIKKLRDAGATSVGIDVEGVDPQVAGERSFQATFTSAERRNIAEAARLALFKFTLKTGKKDKPEEDKKVDIHPLGVAEDDAAWQSGILTAYAQNLAREVREKSNTRIKPKLIRNVQAHGTSC